MSETKLPDLPENICMCRHKSCVSADKCHRHTKAPSTDKNQSYANFFVELGADKCGGFMSNSGEE